MYHVAQSSVKVQYETLKDATSSPILLRTYTTKPPHGQQADEIPTMDWHEAGPEKETQEALGQTVTGASN